MAVLVTMLFAIAASMILQVGGQILTRDGARIVRLLAIGLGGRQATVAVAVRR